MTSELTGTWYLYLLPEILLLVLLAVVIAANGLVDDKRRIGLITAWGSFLILGVVALLALLFEPFNTPAGYDLNAPIWGGMIVHGPIAVVFRVIFLLGLMLTSLISVDTPRLQKGEYSALLVTATLGFNFMAMSSDFIMMFVALETSSISLYLLAGFLIREQRSPEAGMKYFVYGAFASGLMLFGMSMMYGLTAGISYTSTAGVETIINGTNIYVLGDFLTGALNPLSVPTTIQVYVLVSAVLVLVGLGFKISAVPFHFWAPDVYEGAPTPVTAFVSTASKAAGFAIVLRVFNAGTFGAPNPGSTWWSLLVAMCVMTMIVGNVLAIFQRNIKRMLAYSSIAQAGYVMVALVSFDASASGAALFYLLMYVLTNIAAFGIVVVVSNVTGADNVEDFNGLSRRSPYLAVAMLLALLSLGGIPPTAGFFGKFFIFKAAVEQGQWVLALVGILTAFISLYYYLNVVKYIYLYRSDEEDVPIPVSRAMSMGIVLSTVGILYLGIFAGPAYRWTQSAAALFFQ